MGTAGRQRNRTLRTRAAEAGLAAALMLAGLGGAGAAAAAEAAQAEGTATDQVCVVYWTWWENTKVSPKQSAAADPEVVTGASLQAPGHVGRLAKRIAERFGVEAAPIRTAEPYPNEYRLLLPVVRAEHAQGRAKPLAAKQPDLSRCGTVFIGFPNWDYDMPQGVKDFLAAAPSGFWRGRTVIPFASTGTGGWGEAIESLKALAPGASIEHPFAVSRRQVNRYDELADAWLDGFADEVKAKRDE